MLVVNMAVVFHLLLKSVVSDIEKQFCSSGKPEKLCYVKGSLGLSFLSKCGLYKSTLVKFGKVEFFAKRCPLSNLKSSL